MSEKARCCHCVVFVAQSKLVHAEVWPWYDFAFRPARTCEDLLRTLDHTGAGCSLVQDVVREMSDLTCSMRRGEHTEEIAQMLGTGALKARNMGTL